LLNITTRKITSLPNANKGGDKRPKNAEGKPPTNKKFRDKPYDGSDGKVDKLTTGDNKVGPQKNSF